MKKIINHQTPWENWAAGEVKYLLKPTDRKVDPEAGIWRGTSHDIPAGTMVTYKRNELIYIISGRLKLEFQDGPTQELGPGDAIHFAAGDHVQWTLLTDTLEEFYVYIP